ncbi:hypothetical protein LK994_07875 [Ferruginibacter lapsinanis]|uniref:hypothetical protein n=1 Tax=Ferruginibacter lapsinanis TaxID=563172 RepID=UPI001E55E6EF|nr:hypothetical protein [Ferruginibacter lapsinanis]UEG48552.1 hypothetical protein LK994_07875 [Ferruginibacter lapsinanis]
MNRRSILVLSLLCVISFAQAQDEEKSAESTKGFKKENFFTGGNIGLGFGSGTTSFGISPHFGYSINKWIDVAVSVNYNYISQRDYYEVNDKLRQTTIGPGAFVRLFPVKFLFAQAQYEHNFIRQKYIPATGSYISPAVYKVESNSLLIGAGYTSGRSVGNNSYYYFSLMFDVLKDPYSPYLDTYGRVLPVVRAGYNIALFQGRNKKY